MTLSYEYDAIGGLTSERLQHGTLDWLIRHTYTANGDVAGLIWPDGGSVGFAPNALGQATQAGVFASGAAPGS